MNDLYNHQPFQATHRHADGGEYQVLAHIKIKERSGEWAPGVLYRNSEGMLFARFGSDFVARFTPAADARLLGAPLECDHVFDGDLYVKCGGVA